MESRPDTVWVTGNVTEAIPGLPTPLTWTFFSSMIRSSLAGALVDIGALSLGAARRAVESGDPPIGIFHGHPAGNIELFLRAAAASPGNSAAATELQMFGATLSAHRYPDHHRRYLPMAVRMPIAFSTVSRRLRRHRADSVGFWRESVRTRPDLERARTLIAQAAAGFATVGRPHLLQLMLAQGLYEQLTRLTVLAGCPGLETHLLTGSTDLEEGGLVESLAAVGAGQQSLDAFIGEYGYHAPSEGELASASWREHPAQLDVIIRGYRDLDRPASAERAMVRAEAEARFLSGVSPARRPGARVVLRMARAHMPMRNVGKNAYLRLIDVARFAARVVGDELAARGALEQPDDAFMLTLDEIITAEIPNGLAALAADRRARRDRYAAHRIRDLAWQGMPALVPVDATVDRSQTEVVGTPVYPGVVEGVVRIIANPSEIDDVLTREDVIVARTTDPGWAAIMLTAGAFVIDIGSPMSHAAVVARELGVPCVIGTENGTSVFRNGQRVRVDGRSGRVSLLSTVEGPDTR